MSSTIRVFLLSLTKKKIKKKYKIMLKNKFFDYTPFKYSFFSQYVYIGICWCLAVELLIIHGHSVVSER